MSAENACRPRDVQILVEHAMNRGRPMFIWGPPGVGKSEIVEGIGRKQNRPVIDMRLLLMEPTDIKGIPYYNAATETMRWAKPSELPEVVNKKNLQATIVDLEKDIKKLKGDELFAAEEKLEMMTLVLAMQDAILFLDELNAAPGAVQGAAYQLILNRKVGEYELPEGVSIIAAGNRETDKGITYRMPSPLANRFVHIEMKENFDDWQVWAINHNVHPDVVGYLSHHSQHLFDFNPKSSGTAFATPRSWVFVSDLLDDNLLDSLELKLVKGTVGEGVAGEFAQHRKIAAKMPKPADILSGKVKDLKVKEISAMFSLTVSLCYLLQGSVARANDESEKDYDLDEWHKNVDNFFQYMMDNFKTEMIVLGAKTALRDYDLPINHRKLKNFKEFYEKYGPYILDD